MRAAVVGHVEWIEFARADAVPASGAIAHAADPWEEVGGGGAVAAVQLAKLAGGCDLFTRLGDDPLGARAGERLEALGVTVHAEHRGATRRALTLVEPRGERTIVTLGERLEPQRLDPLPWHELAASGAAYYTAGDAGALRAARQARALVATSRQLHVLAAAGVQLDALVGSASDPAERFQPGAIDPPPGLVARTAGPAGGTFVTGDGRSGRWEAAPLPGPVADAYGCGDSFAAGLAFGLGDGRGPEEALELAARCGAAALTGHGPFEGQLRLVP